MGLLKKIDINEVFGNEAGEEESPEFLKEVYIESPIYKKAIGNDRIVCIRSRKGVGKSALLSRAYQQIESKDTPCLWLSPTDLAVAPENDYNLLVDKIKKRLARLCVGKLGEKIGFSSEGAKDEAIMWAEKDGFRSKDFISRLAKTFQDAAKAKLDVNLSDEAVNRLLTRLADGNKLIVFIDDIDRGWSPTGPDSVRLKAQISAIREIARECESIDFKLSLREDVWQYLELNDEQIDKFRQYTHFLKWDDITLRKIIGKRIYHFVQRTDKRLLRDVTDDISSIYLIFCRTYHWFNDIKQIHEVLTKLSRRRPRDILQLAKGAAKRAQELNHLIIEEDDLKNEWVNSFSRIRVLDLCKEFKNECPEIESLINVFGGKKNTWVMPYTDVITRIKSVNGGHIPIHIFSKRVDDVSCLAFLYRSGFISAREEVSHKDYRHLEYEDAPSLVEARVGIEKFNWEIHAAFRPHLETLQPSPFHMATYKEKKKNRY